MKIRKRLEFWDLAVAMIILALSKLALSIAKAYWIIKKANHDFNSRD